MEEARTFAIVDEIYDSALKPERWPQTLSSVASMFGCAFMSVIPYRNHQGIYMSAGADAVIDSYAMHWHKHI